MKTTFKGQTVITDFVVAKANGTTSAEIKKSLRKLHTADQFCVILPEAATKYVCGYYDVSIPHEKLMAGDDGSPVYKCYRDTKAVAISSINAEVKKK